MFEFLHGQPFRNRVTGQNVGLLRSCARARRRTGSLGARQSTPAASDPSGVHHGASCASFSRKQLALSVTCSSCLLSQGPTVRLRVPQPFLLPYSERSKIPLKGPFCRCPACELVPGSPADPEPASSPAPLRASSSLSPALRVSWLPPLSLPILLTALPPEVSPYPPPDGCGMDPVLHPRWPTFLQVEWNRSLLPEHRCPGEAAGSPE